MAASVALLAVVIGPVLKVIGTIATVGGKAVAAVSAIGASLTKLSVTAAKAGGALGAFSGIFGGLGTLANIGSIGLGVGAFGGILATLGLVQQQFGDQLDAMFTMAQEKGPEIISGLSQGIASSIPELVSLGTTLLTNFLDTITANLPALMVGGAQILGSLISGFAENLPELVGGAIRLLGSFIRGLIMSLPELIAAGGDLIRGLVSGFIENLPLLWEEINSLGSTIRDLLSEGLGELPESLQEIINKYQEWSAEHPILSSFLEGLVIGLGVVATALGAYTLAMTLANIVTTAFAAIIAFLTHPITLVIAAIAALIALVYTLWQNWEMIGPMLVQVWENVSMWVVETVSAMVSSVVSWFSQMWSGVTTFVNNIATSIRTGFNTAWNTVKERTRGMYNAVVEWFGKIPGKIRELWGRAQSYLANVNLYNIGRNIINGLWSGLNSAWGRVSSWISEKANSISSLWSRALRIFSPSRVMREDIGRNIIIGLLHGLEDIWPKITGFMDKAISYIAGVDFTTPDLNIGADYALNQSNQTTITTRGMMEETNLLLRKLLQKDTSLIMNGRVLSEEILDDINELNELYNNRNIKIQGGVV